MSYQLPELPYSYEALEPVINREIMELHHQKHHNAYVANLNKALESYKQAEAKNDIAQMITLQSAINFNGGGHINHCLFWENLAPKGEGDDIDGEFQKAIEKSFGSVDKMIEEMSAKTAAVQGSGWGWLAMIPQKKCLKVATCVNQDPLAAQGLIPLLGIDVWEHAYYLQYKNVRPDYVKAIWEIINWKVVKERFEKALKS